MRCYGTVVRNFHDAVLGDGRSACHLIEEALQLRLRPGDSVSRTRRRFAFLRDGTPGRSWLTWQRSAGRPTLMDEAPRPSGAPGWGWAAKPFIKQALID
jgi:hypothetical protein